MPTPYDHPAAVDPAQLLRECEVRRSRASGPGGQHRNKVETGIELIHRPTGVTGWASERRSQPENQQVALRRLRLNLAVAVRRPLDPHAGTSDLWRSRLQRPRGAAAPATVAARPQGRIVVNPGHRDYPALLAEALDVLAAVGWEPKPAAAILGCSMSQLVRFIKDEPRALVLANQERERRGLHALK